MARLTKRQARAKGIIQAFIAYRKARAKYSQLHRLQSWQKRARGRQINPLVTAPTHSEFSTSSSPNSQFGSHYSETSQSSNQSSDSEPSESSLTDSSDDFSENDLFSNDDALFDSDNSYNSDTSYDGSEFSDAESDGMPELVPLDASDFDDDSDDLDLNSNLSSNHNSSSSDDSDGGSDSASYSPPSSDSEFDLDWDGDAEVSEDEGGVENHNFKHRLTRQVIAEIEAMYAQRYEQPRDRFPRGPATLPHLLNVLKHQRPDHFRQELRISPYTFDALVTRIIHDPVFSNNSQNEQIPVEEQLAIYLYRLGHFGNAAGLDKVAKWAGYSKGTITLATRRVMTALLRPEFIAENIRPPTRAEKEKAKRWVEEHSCYEWRDGWCMVDGTLIPLYNRPYWYGESYFDRKCNYSLNIQIISLPNLRIIDIGYGHTGSTHDASAWQKTRFFQEHERYLRGSEFIWADSAYPIEEWLVAPYKSPEREEETNAIFNNHLSMVRIRSEHAIGFLKGRFQSLKGLRVDIRGADTHKFATYWVLASVAVHNFAIEKEEEERGDEADDETDPFMAEGLSYQESPDLDGNHSGGSVSLRAGSRRLLLAKARREELKRLLLAAKDYEIGEN